MKNLNVKNHLFTSYIFAFIVFMSGCSTSENGITSEKSLKSAKGESLKETTQFSGNEQKVLNEFINGDQWKLMMLGSDPTIKTEDDFKKIKFSVVPAFSVDENVDLSKSENQFVNKIYKKTTDIYIFIGRVDNQVITKTVARPNHDGTWRFEIPALKSQMVEWGKKYDAKKAEADGGEVFFLQMYGLLCPAFYKKGELKWMMGHLNGIEKDEAELVISTLKKKEMIAKNKKYYDELKAKNKK